MNDEHEWLPPTLGDWERTGESFGEGAQAVVVGVVHREGKYEGKHVAKVLKPKDIARAKDDKVRVGRFREEVSKLRTLNEAGCPSLVAVLEEHVRDEGAEHLFYVMPEYACSLGKWDKDANKILLNEEFAGDVDRVLTVVDQVLAAVEFYVQEPTFGYTHRDIHSENVFLDKLGGEAFLGDFGLVLARDEEPPREFSSALSEEFGPWRWRPPELTRASPISATEKSDVFLVGGLLYELLSGGEYLDEVEPPGGSLGHRTEHMDLSRRYSDPRIAVINEVLDHVLVRSPDRRMKAALLRQGLKDVRVWEGGGCPPPSLLFPEEELELVATDYHEKVQRESLRDQKKKLDRFLSEVAGPLKVQIQNAPESRIERIIEIAHISDVNDYLVNCDTDLPELTEFDSNDTAWGKILVRLRMDPLPSPTAYFLVGLRKDGRRVLVFLQRQPTTARYTALLTDLPIVGSGGYDPVGLVRAGIADELRRLGEIMLRIIKNATLGDEE